MCESFGVLEASRWPVLVAGVVLSVGSIELGWKSRRIAVWNQRRMEEARDRPVLRLFYLQIGGFLDPELHQIALVFSAALGLLLGVFLLVVGICGEASA